MASQHTLRDDQPPLSPAGARPAVDEGLRADALALLYAQLGEIPLYLFAGITHHPKFGSVWRGDHVTAEAAEARRPLDRLVAWRMPDGGLGTRTASVEDGQSGGPLSKYEGFDFQPPPWPSDLPPPHPAEGETPVDDPDLVHEGLAIQAHVQIMGATITHSKDWGNIFRFDGFEYDEQKKDLWSRYVVWRQPEGRVHVLSCTSIDAGELLPEHGFVRELTKDRPPNYHPPLTPAKDETAIRDPGWAEECRTHWLPDARVLAAVTTESPTFGKVYRADARLSELDEKYPPLRHVIWRAPDGELRSFLGDSSEAEPLPPARAS